MWLGENILNSVHSRIKIKEPKDKVNFSLRVRPLALIKIHVGIDTQVVELSLIPKIQLMVSEPALYLRYFPSVRGFCFRFCGDQKNLLLSVGTELLLPC